VSEWLLPLAVLVASVTLTYFFCLRPMLRGHRSSTRHQQATDLDQLDAAVAQARNELSRLRAETRNNPSPRTTSQGQR
jgi:hypothetical protein